VNAEDREAARVVQPTPRWFLLPEHAEQDRLEDETWPFGPVRYAIVAAGRRSYKTERMKRRAVRHCLACARHPDELAILGGPTHAQAKRIFWRDVLALSPKEVVADVSKSELTITYINGAQLMVAGLDVPARVEGRPIDWIGVTEFANIRAETWEAHLRPALQNTGDGGSERLGAAWLEGVPEGKQNDLYRLRGKFLERIAAGDPEYGVYWWKSADVLPVHVIEAERASMDPRLFRQEYEASFEDFAGRAYYPFTREKHASETLRHLYDPRADLILCFDFNVAPGVAVIAQDVAYKGRAANIVERPMAALGEVWIPHGSTTPRVCAKIAADWGKHEGRVLVYGDATGGARGSAKVAGSDWDLIFAADSPVRRAFGGRMQSRVQRKNPKERVRLNAVNHLLETAETPGKIGFIVDPVACPRLVEDFEGVVILEGSAGELDKDSDSQRTHLTDAIGYAITERHPVGDGKRATFMAPEDIWAPR